MTLMLVGADYLAGIEKNLQAMGVNNVYHMNGRTVKEQRKIKIPSSVGCVVVFTDFVNHLTAANVKKRAKEQNLPVIFSKRSWCVLQEKLADLRLEA